MSATFLTTDQSSDRIKYDALDFIRSIRQFSGSKLKPVKLDLVRQIELG